jgi:hypothetical protein
MIASNEFHERESSQAPCHFRPDVQSERFDIDLNALIRVLFFALCALLFAVIFFCAAGVSLATFKI